MPEIPASLVRRGRPGDLGRIAEIQARCPEASQWNPADYLEYSLLVGLCEGSIAGFLVTRAVAEDEREILNLAVDPKFRNRGVARALITDVISGFKGLIFLEVRESNESARKFYETLGFEELTRRPEYYQHPPETGIVMKFHSC